MERLNDALMLGLREYEYWNMSWDEVLRYFEAENKRRLYEDRNKAMFVHRLAELTGIAVCAYFNGKGRDYPEIERAFPSFFDTEEMREAREERHQKEMTQRFLASAERWNARFKDTENGRTTESQDNSRHI